VDVFPKLIVINEELSWAALRSQLSVAGRVREELPFRAITAANRRPSTGREVAVASSPA
jgi:hypothetical protein